MKMKTNWWALRLIGIGLVALAMWYVLPWEFDFVALPLIIDAAIQLKKAFEV